MAELLIKTVRELPNGNILLEKHLFFLSERDIIELRKKTNWIKGDKGRFAGSVPMGGGGSLKNDLTNAENSGIMKSGSDTVTSEKEQEYGVPYGADAINADMEYINSEEFANKFKNITENEAVNRTLLECSRAAIEHRNGTLYEDMYLINGNTGEIIGKQLDTPYKQSINHNDEMREALSNAKMKNIPVIALHTHPEGYPPSVDDFNSAFEHNYLLGIVAGHNGQIYLYKAPMMLVDDVDIIQSNINFSYKSGVDIDRAHQEIYVDYGLKYTIL